MLIRDGIQKYFNKDIDVYNVILTRNSFGEMEKNWVKDRSIEGRIRPLRGGENYRAGAEHQMSTHRLYTNDANINETQEIGYNNMRFDVLFVANPMNFSEFWQIDLQLIT